MSDKFTGTTTGCCCFVCFNPPSQCLERLMNTAKGSMSAMTMSTDHFEKSEHKTVAWDLGVF